MALVYGILDSTLAGKLSQLAYERGQERSVEALATAMEAATPEPGSSRPGAAPGVVWWQPNWSLHANVGGVACSTQDFTDYETGCRKADALAKAGAQQVRLCQHMLYVAPDKQVRGHWPTVYTPPGHV